MLLTCTDDTVIIAPEWWRTPLLWLALSPLWLMPIVAASMLLFGVPPPGPDLHTGDRVFLVVLAVAGLSGLMPLLVVATRPKRLTVDLTAGTYVHRVGYGPRAREAFGTTADFGPLYVERVYVKGRPRYHVMLAWHGAARPPLVVQSFDSEEQAAAVQKRLTAVLYRAPDRRRAHPRTPV